MPPRERENMVKRAMLKEENIDGIDGGGSTNNWARLCDTCWSATCTVYCKAHSAYLCTGCDARIHDANRVTSHHERVWMCEACEHTPAFICKADAAYLCTTCDTAIHSTNPMAHHRVPVLPIPGSLYAPLDAVPIESQMKLELFWGQFMSRESVH